MEELGYTGAGLVATGWAGRKMLGPVLDEIGKDLRERYSDRRMHNLNRIGQKAQAKLGDSINEPGEVHPRLAVAVLEDGSWCDDEVMSEYLGGILAAARTPDGADDRGVAWARLVSGLATHDIYVHYLIYDAMRRLYAGRDLELGKETDQELILTYLPEPEIVSAMGLDRSVKSWDTITQSVVALHRSGLVGDGYAMGYRVTLGEALKMDLPEDGILVCPSSAGLELFLWAHGHRLPATEFLRADLPMEPVADLGRVDGAREAKELRVNR